MGEGRRQREKNLGSRVTLLPGKLFPTEKFFKKNAKITFAIQKKSIRKRKPLVKNIGRSPDSLEDFQTVWTISRQSGRFPDSLEDFQTVLKISGQYERLPYSLGNVQS